MPFLSWAELHGALTHMPVAFLLAVVVFEAGAILFHKPEWRVVSFWLLAGAVAVAVPSLITGWVTGNDLKFTSGPAPSSFATHRLFAFTTSGLAIVLLLWRVKAHDRLSGKTLWASILLSAVIAACVSYTGFLGGRMVFGGSPETAYVPIKPTDKVAVPRVAPELVSSGQKLFKTLPCLSCHHMEGKGGVSGPDLTHEARRHADMNWHITHLKNPQHIHPNSDMPPFDSLSNSELKALAAFLATRE